MPNTDQTTGERSDRLVSAALKQTRSGVDPIGNSPGVFFGQNALHVFEPGVSIRLGDSVTVEARANKRNVELMAA